MIRFALVVISITLVAACSDDSGGDIDAAVDAESDLDATDAPPGPCGADYQMTGEYVDWDSTNMDFDGVENATWTVIGDTARTATTAPNGRIIMCLSRASTVTIAVTQNETPPDGPYIEARFVADPAVLSVPGGIFSSRGLQQATVDIEYDAIMSGMTFDTAKGHVLVYKRGAPTAVTLGAQASFVSDGVDDDTWESGNSGTFILFPNVPVNPSATLSGTFTGPTTIPVEANHLTIVPIS
jgi:hypothetical protein